MRTATVFFSPPRQVMTCFFIDSPTNKTVCVPAGVDTPTRGVSPSGRPSSTTLDAGMELRLSVQVPPLGTGSAFGAGAGAGAGAGSALGATAAVARGLTLGAAGFGGEGSIASFAVVTPPRCAESTGSAPG